MNPPTAADRRAADGRAADGRNITTGWEIPREGYCDQPYVVVLDDGTWLCLLTTGPGREGDTRQHIVATRSADQGRTWSAPVDVEPQGPPESSWVMPVATPYGRVYAVYVHNTDDLRQVRSLGGPIARVDTLGHYVFKFSDDGGRSWSDARYEIPVRAFAIDRANLYGGTLRFFWGVGKPVTLPDGAVVLGAAKVGNFGEGFMATSEGFFLRSDNLLVERDPTLVRWETLPAGDVGLRAPLGPVADEHNPVPLSDGSLYCTYRTTEGYLCHAYSRDGGRTWTPPAYATYEPPASGEPGAAAPGQTPYAVGQAVPVPGRRLKHPRAATFVKRFANGRYLLWFHNHGGRWYQYRNPAWVCGGVEQDGPDGPLLRWSEPEILLYDDDADARISYPDFVEVPSPAGSRYFVTETQKTVARVHEIDPALLDGLWRQHETRTVVREGLLLEWERDAGGATGAPSPLPALPRLARSGGFTLDLWLRLDAPDAGEVVLDGRTGDGAGLVLATAGEGGNMTLRLTLDDGRRTASWDCDPGVLRRGRAQHVAVTVDGGPKVITFVVDGRLCDGGMSRQYGWGRFPGRLDDVTGAGRLTRGPAPVAGTLYTLRVYGRPLRTSEAVGNFRAGRPDSAPARPG
jgi:hypothetical protein